MTFENLDCWLKTLLQVPGLREKATAFMGVSKDTTRSSEDVNSTPLPGESLAMFYSRSRNGSCLLADMVYR